MSRQFSFFFGVLVYYSRCTAQISKVDFDFRMELNHYFRLLALEFPEDQMETNKQIYVILNGGADVAGPLLITEFRGLHLRPAATQVTRLSQKSPCPLELIALKYWHDKTEVCWTKRTGCCLKYLRTFGKTRSRYESLANLHSGGSEAK